MIATDISSGSIRQPEIDKKGKVATKGKHTF
jgi:hypothetical protein